jgi:Skp family chaperone for outer membrane proteins
MFTGSAAAQTPPAPKSTLPAQLFTQAPNTPFPDGAKIAFINIQLIAQESAVGKAASEQINKLRGVRLAELDSRAKVLKALQDKQGTSAGILNKAAAEKLQQEIDRAEMEVQYVKQTAERELTSLNDELMADFSSKVRPVVEGIRAEKQLWAVFLMNENLVAMMPGLDVSSEVIKRLDAKK